MGRHWQAYKDGVLTAFVLATVLGILHTSSGLGRPSVVPSTRQCKELQSHKGLFKTFDKFYPFYLCEHTNPITKLFHFIGTFNMCMILLKIFGGSGSWSTKLKLLVFGMVQGYGWAWVSHFFIEMNKPATFKQPIYSAIADFKMFSDHLTLNIPPFWKF